MPNGLTLTLPNPPQFYIVQKETDGMVDGGGGNDEDEAEEKDPAAPAAVVVEEV